MSVVILRKLQEQHPDMAYWRIVPRDSGRQASAWLNEMAEKHPKERACVFDEWGMINPLTAGVLAG
jgi:hypothetical protein